MGRDRATPTPDGVVPRLEGTSSRPGRRPALRARLARRRRACRGYSPPLRRLGRFPEHTPASAPLQVRFRIRSQGERHMATPSLPVAAETQREERRHDWRRVALGTALAFAVPLLLVSLAGMLVRELSGADGSNAVDAHVLDWMIDRSEDLTDVMRAVTSLGGTLVLVPLTVVGVVLLSSMRRFGSPATSPRSSSARRGSAPRPRPSSGDRGRRWTCASRESAARRFRRVTQPRPRRPTSRWPSSSVSWSPLRRCGGCSASCARPSWSRWASRAYTSACTGSATSSPAGSPGPPWALGAAAAFRPLGTRGAAPSEVPG